MTLESSEAFQPTIAALTWLRVKAQRKDDPLARYASTLLNIVGSYDKDFPTIVKALIKAVYEFAINIIETNGKPTLDDLHNLQSIEAFMKADSSDRNFVAKAGALYTRFRLESKTRLGGYSHPNPFSQGSYRQNFNACTINYAMGNINTTTNNNMFSYLNCFNEVHNSEIAYGNVNVNMCQPRSDPPHFSPLSPTGNGLGVRFTSPPPQPKFEEDEETENGSGPVVGSRPYWSHYPQSQFANWTQWQQHKSGIARVVNRRLPLQ
ncbi:hypothetical protein C8R42DRAFT_649168 [Lentinula raphanica]|nr:hypothetical protein C8R42DRAFT_649168 [Lentinula raphanica]